MANRLLRVMGTPVAIIGFLCASCGGGGSGTGSSGTSTTAGVGGTGTGTGGGGGGQVTSSGVTTGAGGKAPSCGDGHLDPGEECDEGSLNADDAVCTSECKNAYCGDSLVAPGEACDDGNMVDADGCNNDCVVSGTPIWTQVHDSASSGHDVWKGAATDATGNVIVTGSETVVGQGLNVITRKYDSGGNVLWTQTYAGAVADGADEGHGVAADPDGNVIVIGYETTAAQGKNIWIRKYDPNGATLWTQSINGSPLVNFDDVGYGIVADSMGALFIAGAVNTTAGQSRDTIVGKVDPSNGQFIWFDTYNGTGSKDDEATSVALDGMGNVIAAGLTRAAGSYDVWVRKYADLGASESIVWTKTHDGSASGVDAAFAIAVDSLGNAVVAGAESVGGQGLNIWVQKYDLQGNTTWTQDYGSPSTKDDVAEGVAIDASDNIVVVGFEGIADGTTDGWARKYSPAGDIVWTQGNIGSAGGNDAMHGVAIGLGNAIGVAGFETVAGAATTNGWLRLFAP